MDSNFFRKESLDKIKSPEQLNDYIRVSSIGIWAVIVAVILLVVGFGVWAFFGNATTIVNMIGVSENGTVTCYTDNASSLKSGMEIKLSDGSKGKIVSVSETPQSKNEISSEYDEYTSYSLNLSEWNYKVVVKAEGCNDGVVTVSAIVESVRPISFIGKAK